MHLRVAGKFVFAGAACGVLLCFVGTAVARIVVAPPPAQELNPAARAPSPEQTKPEAGPLAPPEAGPCPFRDSQLTFTLSAVTFRGAQDIGADVLAPAYAGMIGRRLPVAAICNIRDRASSLLFHSGILARVDIPSQNISKGIVELDITEAYVAAVEVHGDAGPARAKVEDYLDMLRGMKPFDINQAQRYLFLANDVPGVHIEATLKPSRKGPGAIILDVAVAYTPVTGALDVQNYNSEETGPWSGTARVDLNSFTSWGDQTSLVAFTAADFREERVLQGIEAVRLGSEGLVASLSLAYGVTKPGADLSQFQIGGSSLVGEFDLSYPLIRSRLVNLNLEGGFDVIEEKVHIFSNVPLNHDGLRVFYGKIDGNRRWLWQFPVSLSGDVEIRKGAEILGSSRAGDPMLSIFGAKPDAWDIRADGEIAVQWLPLFNTTGRVAAQFTDQRLASYEDYTVGNLTIVRGYDPSALTGDRGIGASLQTNVGPFRLNDTLGITGFAFFDIAHLSNLDVLGQNPTVRSVGGGLVFDLSLFSRWTLHLTYAHPLDSASPFVGVNTPPPDDRYLLDLTYSF